MPVTSACACCWVLDVEYWMLGVRRQPPSSAGPADRQMLNGGHKEQFFFEKPVGVDNYALAHRGGDGEPVCLAELRPLGTDHGGIGAMQGGRDIRTERYLCELLRQLLHGR